MTPTEDEVEANRAWGQELADQAPPATPDQVAGVRTSLHPKGRKPNQPVGTGLTKSRKQE